MISRVKAKVACLGVMLTLAGTAGAARAAADGKAPAATSPAPAGVAKAKGDVATQSIMHSIFQPLSVVLPLSFDDQAFQDPKNKKLIEGQLKALMDNAGNLEKHARGKERSFEFVAKSLRIDAKHLYRWYTKERYDEARFTLHNMTENCIACHSSFPETHKVPPASAFFAAIKTDKMPPVERAHFYVMSRQFDQALSTYEAFFLSDVPPTSLIMLGSFTDYLKVAVHVKNDLERPRKTIQSVIGKAATPQHVKEQLKRWSDSLADYAKSGLLAKEDLDSARRAMKLGRDHMEFPRDRDGLIDYLVASAILNRYVHSHRDKGVDVAEAYYMLGVTEGLLAHSFWISRQEYYFESAVRMAPGSSFAPKAYALLEESYVTNYSGSAGTHVPDDVRELLSDLRKLIEDAKGPKT